MQEPYGSNIPYILKRPSLFTIAIYLNEFQVQLFMLYLYLGETSQFILIIKYIYCLQ